jgi:hypothetical protein
MGVEWPQTLRKVLVRGFAAEKGEKVLVSVRELCLLFQGVNVSRLEGAPAQSMRGHR